MHYPKTVLGIWLICLLTSLWLVVSGCSKSRLSLTDKLRDTKLILLPKVSHMSMTLIMRKPLLWLLLFHLSAPYWLLQPFVSGSYFRWMSKMHSSMGTWVNKSIYNLHLVFLIHLTRCVDFIVPFMVWNRHLEFGLLSSALQCLDWVILSVLMILLSSSVASPKASFYFFFMLMIWSLPMLTLVGFKNHCLILLSIDN